MNATELPSAIRALYPFTSKWFMTESGTRQHYLDEGSGEAILFLHGNPTWSFFYRNLISDLRTTHRCIAPDHLGMGLSEVPDPNRFSYDLAGHIENVVGLVESLKLTEFSLVVHDWGGAIGMGLAARMPERIKRIVILNTAAFHSTRIPFRIRICRWPVIGSFLVRRLNAFVRAALFMTTEKGLPASVRAGYLFPYAKPERRRSVEAFVRDIPLEADHPSAAMLNEIDASLERFADHPVMIAWGGRDWCFNEEFLEGWRRRFLQAESYVFADAGHFVLEDEGETLNPMVAAFLRQG